MMENENMDWGVGRGISLDEHFNLFSASSGPCSREELRSLPWLGTGASLTFQRAICA
jgi:hypothetical protein